MTPGLKKLYSVVMLIMLATTLGGALNAAEKITEFDSAIIIEPNGDLLVRETIDVVAEGAQIRRGIFRDFPRYNENPGGKLIQVGFDIISVKRDGEPEPWRTQRAGRFTRIYIGDKDVYIKNGPHTYEIEYRTDRQLRFFETHDELYWNVTGTEWEFTIENATAKVTLPPDISATDTFIFTGRFGSVEKNATATIADGGAQVLFSTTRPLGKRSGLTIGVKMPAGSFVPVPGGKRWKWIWRDYKAEIIAVLVLVIASGYYFIRWWQIGRDPPAGVIVPRWEAPPGYSPALMNYIREKGFGAHAWKGLTSALLNLAVKGYVVLENLDTKPRITRTEINPQSRLTVGEAALLVWLDKYKSRSLTVSKSNGKRVQKMHEKFKSAMEDEHRRSYYSRNWGSIALGIAISIAGLIAILASGGVSETFIGLFVPVIFLGIFATIVTSRLGRVFRSGGNLASKFIAVISFSIFGFAALSTLIGIIGNITISLPQPLLLICILGLAMLNALFFFLLGAPTRLGRQKMDIIEGLETYLVLAEKDRMNLAGAPKMSPSHYETLLPYAVALGVEKPWSKAFQAWLLTAAAATAAVAHYSPGWYRGRFDTNGIGRTFGGMADNIESSFTASLPTPKSSSSGFSGGGGSSGGGGGGGGGGGW